MEDLMDIPEEMRQKLENNKVLVENFLDRQTALDILKESIELYNKTFLNDRK